MNLNFYLVGHNEVKRISAYYFIGGKRVAINTGLKVHPKYWDKEKQRAKKSLTGSVELNRSLNRISERSSITYSEFKSNGEPNSKLIDQLKKVIKPENEIRDDFFEQLDRYIEIKKETVTKSTINHFKSLRTHLTDYSKKKRKKITFDSLDLNFHDSFVLFLQKEKNHSVNTIANNIKKLKIFLNWCFDREIIKNQKYKRFTTKTIESPQVYLTEEELMKLFNMDLKNSSLNKVRDMFCFMCFTGQRSRIFKI